jgi:hypothetical protein
MDGPAGPGVLHPPVLRLRYNTELITPSHGRTLRLDLQPNPTNVISGTIHGYPRGTAVGWCYGVIKRLH